MSDATTFDRVAQVVADVVELGAGYLPLPVTRWEWIAADSLDRAEIFAACETEFQVELSDSACEVLKTVGELAELVEKTKAKVSA